jgi:hypothetical protein
MKIKFTKERVKIYFSPLELSIRDELLKSLEYEQYEKGFHYFNTTHSGDPQLRQYRKFLRDVFASRFFFARGSKADIMTYTSNGNPNGSYIHINMRTFLFSDEILKRGMLLNEYKTVREILSEPKNRKRVFDEIIYSYREFFRFLIASLNYYLSLKSQYGDSLDFHKIIYDGDTRNRTINLIFRNARPIREFNFRGEMIRFRIDRSNHVVHPDYGVIMFTFSALDEIPLVVGENVRERMFTSDWMNPITSTDSPEEDYGDDEDESDDSIDDLPDEF